MSTTCTNSIVTLNVGGHIYTTTRSTLTRYPDSMLGAMFTGDMDTLQDDQGRYFIDRDGTLFRHVLNFLRTSQLVLPGDFKELPSLEVEADFYQIKPLIEALKHYKARREDLVCGPTGDRAAHDVVVVSVQSLHDRCAIMFASTEELQAMVTNWMLTIRQDGGNVTTLLGRLQDNGFTIHSYGVAFQQSYREYSWTLVRNAARNS